MSDQAPLIVVGYESKLPGYSIMIVGSKSMPSNEELEDAGERFAAWLLTEAANGFLDGMRNVLRRDLTGV